MTRPFLTLALIGLNAALVAQQPIDRIPGDGDPADRLELLAFEKHLQQLYTEVLPATLSIAGASGVIVEGGYVLTAGHVIQDSGRRIAMTLPDGRRIEGESLGLNRRTDSGLIRIVSEGEFPFRPMGESGSLEPGQWCLMLGHPSGPRRGRLAAARIGRILEVPAEGHLVTDCPMQSGDSGGPLFDMQGRVIGINSNITANIATNRHVPIDAFRADWQALIEGEVIGGRRRERGFGLQWEHDAERATISSVRSGSLGARAGLVAGDKILKVGDAEVGSRREAVAALREHSGEAVTLELRRGDATMEIRLELPERRRHGPSQTEHRSRRASESMLALFEPLVEIGNHITCEIRIDGERVASGTVVSGEGLIVTKASRLGGGAVTCRIGDREFEARRRGEDNELDLALLQIEAEGLESAGWDAVPPSAGSWLCSPDGEAAPAGIGIASTGLYDRSEHRGWLGISLDQRSSAATAALVMPDSPADQAGLRKGDEFLAVGDIAVVSVEDFMFAMSGTQPGEELLLRIRRDEVELVLPVELATNDRSRPNPQAGLWGPLSVLRSEFGPVIQHDTILRPEDCGGPLLDLDGEVVGVNIARAGRVESLALPTSVVLAFVERTLAEGD